MTQKRRPSNQGGISTKAFLCVNLAVVHEAHGTHCGRRMRQQADPLEALHRTQGVNEVYLEGLAARDVKVFQGRVDIAVESEKKLGRQTRLDGKRKSGMRASSWRTAHGEEGQDSRPGGDAPVAS
jgi:hypothetical protein